MRIEFRFIYSSPEIIPLNVCLAHPASTHDSHAENPAYLVFQRPLMSPNIMLFYGDPCLFRSPFMWRGKTKDLRASVQKIQGES